MSILKDINDLRNAKVDDEEDEDAKAKAKFSEDGCGSIARNKYFEYTTLGVICFNALYLGYDCDFNARYGKPEDLYASNLYGFMAFDNFFCVFFTMELLIRLFAYRNTFHAFCDIAFVFDLFLVLLMVAETWVFAFVGQIDALKQVSILRLLRLTRLLRMGKIMRYFPELQLIVKGMAAAVRSVGCASILLLLVLYVFAIIFTNEYHQGLKDDDDDDMPEIEKLFGSLGKSMRHLLIMGTILDDITACCNAIRSTKKPLMMVVFFACVLVSSFTLFNMLVGILCEVVEATGDGERIKREEKELRDTILRFFRTMDVDRNGVISFQEFMSMKEHPEIMDALEKLDISSDEFNKYAELLFVGEDGRPKGALDYHSATAMIMRLRPGASINACDFNYFRHNLMHNNQIIRAYIAGIEDILENEPDDDDEDAYDYGLDEPQPPAVDNQLQLRSTASAPERPGNQDLAIRQAKSDGQATRARNGPGGAGGQSRGAKPARPGGRQRMTTVEVLAHSEKAVVGVPPPVCSRWQPGPRVSTGARPTSPPHKRPPTSGDVLHSRLEQLQERRRTRSAEVRNTMYAGMRHTGSMPQLPDLRAAAAGQHISDEEDRRPPFSPNQFVID